MPRLKRSSKVLAKSERRAAGMASISATLDLGNNLTLPLFNSKVEEVRAKLAAYNTVLSMVDKAYSDILNAERELGDLSEHMLMGVATKYGKGSDEYEMAGGVRKVERKRRNRNDGIGASSAA